MTREIRQLHIGVGGVKVSWSQNAKGFVVHQNQYFELSLEANQ